MFSCIFIFNPLDCKVSQPVFILSEDKEAIIEFILLLNSFSSIPSLLIK